jgi:hypothetical protein
MNLKNKAWMLPEIVLQDDAMHKSGQRRLHTVRRSDRQTNDVGMS